MTNTEFYNNLKNVHYNNKMFKNFELTVKYGYVHN